MSNAAITQTTVTLQYDAIGNILQDGYWQYTWQNGRQLKAMQHVEAEDADYERLDFAYNADCGCGKAIRTMTAKACRTQR